MSPLIFLKLGGSLITDKDHPRTPRKDVIARLAGEIAEARSGDPNIRLVIGHGSGSFGHVAALKHHTRQGVHTPDDWRGFCEVWFEARALNQIVVEELFLAGLPIIAVPPSATLIAAGGKASVYDTTILERALAADLIPLVNGDTVFDSLFNATILSTEDVFAFLAPLLCPSRILLAGLETGVWADFPVCSRLITDLTPQQFIDAGEAITASASVDVTGGMREKVTLMLQLSTQVPGLETQIFSGQQAGNLKSALLGDFPGTRLFTPLPAEDSGDFLTTELPPKG